MSATRLLTVLGILGGLLATAQGATVVGPDSRAKPEDGVEVLARGPVHEAFAEPSMRRQGAAPPVAKKPPDPVNEIPAEQKPDAANVQWIPGYWAFDDERNDFLWVSGIWRIPPPGRHWLPGYWQQEDAGWQWVSGYWGAQTQNDEQLLPAPPTPIAEALPPAPDDNSGYVPGCWIYQADGYYWRPGFWVPFRPGWLWTSASYIWTPGGYVFVDGYWDHDFHHRGVLFAPAYLGPRFVSRPGWFYRPGYVVLPDLLLQALFVRPVVNHYFFGDYYGPRYARLGYRDWIDFRLGDRHYNALNYYRWQHRNTPRWEENLRANYQGRHDGKLPPPPRTLAAQLKAGTGKNVALLAPVNNYQTNVFKMQNLSETQVQQIHKVSQNLHAVGQHRAKMERQLVGKETNLNQATKFELHKAKTINKPAKEVRTPPPVPTHPKVAPKSKPKPPEGPRGKGGAKQPHHHVNAGPGIRPILVADAHHPVIHSAPGSSRRPARKEEC